MSFQIIFILFLAIFHGAKKLTVKMDIEMYFLFWSVVLLR